MEKLLKELHEKIFSYCPVKDLSNLSCCSQLYHDLVKDILWEAVRIPLCDCKKFPISAYGNLIFTRKIILDNVIGSCCGLEVLKQSPDCEMARILSGFDAGKVRSLVIHTTMMERVQLVLDKFDHIQSLQLQGINDWGWNRIGALYNLESLMITPTYTLSINNQGFRQLLQLKKLKRLHLCAVGLLEPEVLEWIGKCDRLVDLSISGIEVDDPTCLRNLVNLRNLQKLSLSSGGTDPPLNFEPLLELTGVMYLDVFNLGFGSNLLLVCTKMQSLRTLNLTGKIPDNLSSIPLISSLENLKLDCQLTDSFLEHISKSKCLKKLSFRNPWFRRLPKKKKDRLTDKLCLLNTMDSLREITIHGKSEKTELIVQGLCMHEKWRLTTWKDKYSEFCTLTR